MLTERLQLEQAVALQEKLRGIVADDVIDAAIAALLKELAVHEPATRNEQRKLVTVLSADLTAWTALSERLDAEDVRAIQRLYFAAVTQQVLERGGRVEKFIGDAVLAVFGVPQAKEADPENAIRAALAMQQSMAALNYQLAGAPGAPHPHAPVLLPGGALDADLLPLSLRIGVHTGPVFATVGQGIEDFMVTGDTVNLAARLQGAAPSGGVLISHDTWRHVEDLFEVEAQASLTLKGKTEPVRNYLVLRARQRPLRRNIRGVAGVVTKMVGRTEELQVLRDTLAGVRRDRQARMVMVVGEAGVGKSRLLLEFEKWFESLPDPLYCLRGRAAPEGQQTPYGLLRDLFAARFRIEEGDGLEDVRRKLEDGFTAPMPSESGVDAVLALEDAHLLSQLLGYDFSESPHVAALLDAPQQLRTRALTALDAYFGGLSRHHPVVVMVEDLHWADDSSLDAIGRLLLNLRDYPVLVLGAARSGLYRRRPHWGADLTYARQLDLQPLGRRDVEQLLQGILQKAGDVPPRLREMVVDNADGNPFFVEELVKMLIEDGIILTSGGDMDDWHIEAERLPGVQVPPSLTALLQARVDRLPPDERTVLQQASVVGRRFWDQVIEYVQCNDGQSDTDIKGTLSALQAREMVFQREFTSFPETDEFVFKHALLRDVAYESVLRRLRRGYHGLVADWLIAKTGERIGEYTGLIADHLERAGRGDEAIDYLVRAADRARIVDAHEEAVNRYERALTLLEEKSAYEEAARISTKLGLTHQNAFNHKQARQAFDRAFSLWRKAEDQFHTIALPDAPHAFRVARDEPLTLDPTLAYEHASIWVIECLFSGLAQRGRDFEVVPDVAKSWQVSEDGLSYVFTLREDVRWSDGVPVTAGDFEYAWKRRLSITSDPVAATLLDIKNARAFRRGELADADRVGVRAADEHTLIIELEQPAGYFLQLMAAVDTFPVPRHLVAACGEDWAAPTNIATNGPFLLQTWQPGKKLLMVRNPHFHSRVLGNLKEVAVSFGVNWPERVAMYEADELDYLEIAPHRVTSDGGGPLDAFRVRQRHSDEYVLIPAMATSYMGINTSRPPFDDPRVRRALVLATDREAYVDIVLHGLAHPPSGGFVPAEVPGHSPNIGLPYDPAQARQLLAEAGYPDGRGFPAVNALVSTAALPSVDFQQDQWRRNLGIEVTTERLDFGAFIAALHNTAPCLFFWGWIADYPDPDNFLRVGLKLTRSWWQHEPFETLVRQAKQMTDPRERMKLYRQADQILIEQAAVMPLYYTCLSLLLKPWLTIFHNGWFTHTKDSIIRPH